MKSDDAWRELPRIASTPRNRWTASQGGRTRYWLEPYANSHGTGFEVVTDKGRNPRRIDRPLFEAFWKLWSAGKRHPDDYRDAGPRGGMNKLAFYLMPVAAAITGEITTRQWKYGDQRTRDYVLDALRSLGGVASPSQIRKHLAATHPDINPNNVVQDLRLLTVNAFGRANWPGNEAPRTIDGSHSYDVLYQEDDGRYVFFDPAKHGTWVLDRVPGDDKLRPRRIEDSTTVELAACRAALDEGGEFDPTNEADGRRKVVAAIVRRQGQGAFRKALLRAYGGRCAVTGCNVEDALEAAHVRPYLGTQTNVLANGLLLRADVHTLFDLGWLRVCPDTFKVQIAPRLSDSEYNALNGRRIWVPHEPADRPGLAALRAHWDANARNYAIGLNIAFPEQATLSS